MVGMDPRKSSSRILIAIENGLNFAGREVLDEGILPVPALNWILKKKPHAGSIMITGSHIAGNLNGLKFFAFKDEILKIHEQEISELYFSLAGKNTISTVKPKVTKQNLSSFEYQKMLINLCGHDYPKLNKIVVDSGNGAQSEVMSKVLSEIGLPVIAINNNVKGDFIARDTETDGGLKELQNEVLKNKADIGIAYDFDGDRVVFIDELGNFIPGDYSGSLIAKYSDSSKIVTPINTSQVVDSIGKIIIRTKVGSPYVVQAMKESGASFGFEANGGGISEEIMMSRDGGSTTIKLLKIMKKKGKSLSELVNELPKYYLYRVKVDCPANYYQTILDEAKKHFISTKIEEVDGLKIWIDKDWLLFRPSSNAPEFRVFAESKNQESSTALGQNGIKFVKDLINSLK